MALSESIGKGAPQFSHFSFISSIKTSIRAVSFLA